MDKEKARVGFWQTLKTDKDGNQYLENSSSRLFSIIVLPFALLMTWGVIERTLEQFIANSPSWEEVVYSLVTIIIINLLWIAPKHLIKLAEEKGLIRSMMEKKS